MGSLINRLVSTALIFSMFAQLAGVPALADGGGLGGAGGDGIAPGIPSIIPVQPECQSRCGQIRDNVKNCDKDLPDGASASPTPDQLDYVNKCKDNHGQLESQCSALEFQTQTGNWQLIMAGLYTAAAASCAAACAAMWVPQMAEMQPVLNTACTVASGAAGLAQVASIVSLIVMGKPFQKFAGNLAARMNKTGGKVGNKVGLTQDAAGKSYGEGQDAGGSVVDSVGDSAVKRTNGVLDQVDQKIDSAPPSPKPESSNDKDALKRIEGWVWLFFFSEARAEVPVMLPPPEISPDITPVLPDEDVWAPWDGGAKAAQGAQSGGEQSAQNLKEFGKKMLPCVTSAFMGAMAAINGASLFANMGSAKQTCSNIKKLQSDAPVLKVAATGAAGGAGGSRSNPGNGGGGSGLAPGGGGNLISGGNFDGQKLGDAIPAAQGVFAAAKGDPAGEFMSKFPFDRVPKALEKSGTSLDKIAKKLDAGQMPGQILAGLPNIPGTLAADFAKFDEAARNGQLSAAGLGMYSGGGGGGGGGGKSENGFGSLFGGGDDKVGAAGSKTVNLGKPAGPDDDIWHTNFKGTIFDIITGKIDKTRTRVEKLEWTIDINRASEGLPPQK